MRARESQYSSNFIFEASLLSTLFLLLFELAAGSSFYLMESSLFVLVFSFIIAIIGECGFSPLRILRKYRKIVMAAWPIFAFLFLYILWDLVSSSYSTIRQGLWEKYKVVILMLFLAVGILFYANSYEKINRLLWTIMAAGVFSAVFSLLNYAILRIYPIYYGKRLSIRLDYNMFASVLMMGLIVGFFLIQFAPWKNTQKSILLFCLFELISPIIVLSSSRRNYLMLFPISFLLVIDALFCAKESKNSRQSHALARAVGYAVLTFLLILITIFLLNTYLSYAYEQLKRSDEGVLLLEGESSAQDRYETIEKETVSSKRSLIWGIAIEEAKGYGSLQKLIGKGFGYDRQLYKNVDNKELEKTYTQESREKLSAHCFVLADLLNGGWIQVILSAFLWGSIGIFLLILWSAYPIFSQVYFLAFGLIFMNNMISNRFGFLYDKFFWIFMTLLLTEIRLIRRDERRIFLLL